MNKLRNKIYLLSTIPSRILPIPLTIPPTPPSIEPSLDEDEPPDDEPPPEHELQTGGNAEILYQPFLVEPQLELASLPVWVQ